MHLGAVLLTIAALCGAASADAAGGPVVDYTLSPFVVANTLTALDVTMTLQAGPRGRTELDLPDDSAGSTDLWRNLSNLRVDGAEKVEATGPAHRTIISAPGARLRVSYRVISAFDHDPGPNDLDTYKPTVRPRWFWAYGEALFAVPEGYREARFAWTDAPAGFPFVSSVEGASTVVPIANLIESVSVGGSDMTLTTQQVAGAPVSVATIGRYGFDTHAFANLATRIIAGERAFWDAHEGPFLVVLAPLTPAPGVRSSRGEGRKNAFAIMTTSDVPLASLTALIGHEYFHTWNPQRLGGLPDGPSEPAAYWFSEGFTDFYARRLLLRMGVFSLDDFVDAWNQMLLAYANSSVRDAPVSRIVKDFWSDQDVHQLAYQRGAILAATADQRLRARSGGRTNLDDVMRAMQDRTARGHAPLSPQLFLDTARAFGVDMRDDVARIADGGAPAALAPGAFGDCVGVGSSMIAAFDRGYDRQATRRAGVISGVEAGSNAEAAGLKDGMSLIKVEGGVVGDSRVPYSLWVRDQGQERVITYKPAGSRMITVQGLSLPPNLGAEARERCAVEAAGGPPL
jgi:predicted metalloprotease with PDZ domain